MNTTVKKCVQWTALSTVCIVGLFAFMLLAGDENPRTPIPLGEWLVIKFSALMVIALCVWVGKWLHRTGYLPEYLDKLVEEDI